eukprot:Tamp_18832.p1 GENE.Tamp_18832~~Tamp_18832.p1  ORF type:complete len:136 (-),score=7.78 Tamp_18832:664-1071(-)
MRACVCLCVYAVRAVLCTWKCVHVSVTEQIDCLGVSVTVQTDDRYGEGGNVWSAGYTHSLSLARAISLAPLLSPPPRARSFASHLSHCALVCACELVCVLLEGCEHVFVQGLLHEIPVVCIPSHALSGDVGRVHG